MKKRGIMRLLATALSMLLLAGCSGGGSSKVQQGDQDNPAVDQITLRFAWWGGDERNLATQEVIEQFEALHPNVTIEAEYGGNDGYHDKLATQLASQTAADIVQIDPEVFPAYVTTGDYFIDYQDYQINLSNFEEAYLSMPINGRYEQRQLGLPTGISGAGIVVNQDLAEAIGLDFTKPYTWEELLEMGKKVREYDDSLYLLCANKEYITNLVVFNYAKQLVGDTIFDDTSKELNITQQQMQEVFSYVQQLYEAEVVAPASYQAAYSGDNLQSDSNWIDGRYVAAFTYVSSIDVMTAANPGVSYYMSQLPVLADSVQTGWASNTPQLLAVTKTCQNPEVAVAFLDYFFNSEAAIKTLGCTRSVPPTEKARAICTEEGVLSEWAMQGANIAAAMGGTPNDKISSTQESKAILFDSVEAIGYGASTPDQAASDAVGLLSAFTR